MPDYRLYHLNPQGLIAKAQDFHAGDDAAARLAASALSPVQEWELWSGKRLVQKASIDRRQAHPAPQGSSSSSPA